MKKQFKYSLLAINLPPPPGFRFLMPGEIFRDGDLFYIEKATAHFEKFFDPIRPTDGTRVRENYPKMFLGGARGYVRKIT